MKEPTARSELFELTKDPHPDSLFGQWLTAAGAELDTLMREVSEHDRRHGPKRRTRAQDLALVTAKLEALELQRLDLLDDLDRVLSGEEPEEEDATARIEDEAAWMKGARRELNMLIAETWGPMLGNRGKGE